MWGLHKYVKDNNLGEGDRVVVLFPDASRNYMSTKSTTFFKFIFRFIVHCYEIWFLYWIQVNFWMMAGWLKMDSLLILCRHLAWAFDTFCKSAWHTYGYRKTNVFKFTRIFNLYIFKLVTSKLNDRNALLSPGRREPEEKFVVGRNNRQESSRSSWQVPLQNCDKPSAGRPDWRARAFSKSGYRSSRFLLELAFPFLVHSFSHHCFVLRFWNCPRPLVQQQEPFLIFWI